MLVILSGWVEAFSSHLWLYYREIRKITGQEMNSRIKAKCALYILCILLVELFPTFSSANDGWRKCEKDYGYKFEKITQKQIINILESHYIFLTTKEYAPSDFFTRQHDKWLKTLQQESLSLPSSEIANPRRAILCGVDLSGINLKSAFLFEVNLTSANLEDANMQHALLSDSILKKANLTKANLQEAVLQRTNLQGARIAGANLYKGFLYEANLKNADLRYANMEQADLEEANIENAELIKARFESANMMKANLMGSILSRADMKNAFLYGAKLDKAELFATNLQGANLSYATFQEARLYDSNLTDAIFSFANISHSVFEPASPPNSGTLANLIGLPNIEIEAYKGSQGPAYNLSGVVLLRNALKEGGVRNLEREATYLIEYYKTRQMNSIEKWLRKIFVEYTSGYGLHYNRPLLIIIILIFVFSLFYVAPLSTKAYAGADIVRVWPKNNREEVITATADLKIIGYALYFSLLSAFHLGWRDLDVGAWITRLQPKAYIIKARGWARTVSGIQSLISLYLIALWALTYFGRPFE